MSMTDQTVFQPRSPGNHWAYWRVENLKDLPAAAKRRRKSFHFILTYEGAKRQPLTCCYCHQSIEPAEGKHDTYGEYNPKTKRAKVWHYSCGWGALSNLGSPVWLGTTVHDSRALEVCNWW